MWEVAVKKQRLLWERTDDKTCLYRWQLPMAFLKPQYYLPESRTMSNSITYLKIRSVLFLLSQFCLLQNSYWPKTNNLIPNRQLQKLFSKQIKLTATFAWILIFGWEISLIRRSSNIWRQRMSMPARSCRQLPLYRNIYIRRWKADSKKQISLFPIEKENTSIIFVLKKANPIRLRVERGATLRLKRKFCWAQSTENR